jgi:hypothetical protein
MPVQVAVRSYLTAGVAMVGATALIAAPLAVPPPEIHLPAIHASSAAVELAALANPIAEWVTVVQTTFANVAALGTQFQNDPAPILQQILTNQLANASTLATALEGATGGLVAGLTSLPSATLLAAQQLAAGQFSAAVGTLFQAGIGLILAPAISLIGATSIITDTAQRFANVVAAIPNVLLPVGLAAISPIAGAVYAFGDAGQAVIDAARAGDVAGALSALVNIPAIVTNAFLNGYPPQFSTGVFSPLVEGGFGSGLIASLLNARDVFAQALGAPVPPAATATDLPTASTLISLAAAPTKEATVGETAAKTGVSTARVTDLEAAPEAVAATEPAGATPTEPVTEPTTAATEPAATSTEPAPGTTSEAESGSATSTSSSASSTGTTSSETGTSSSSGTASTKPSNDKEPSSSGTASSTGGSASKPAESKKDVSAGSSSAGSTGSSSGSTGSGSSSAS